MTRRTRWELIAGVLLVLGLVAVLGPLLMALPWVLFPLREAGRLMYPGRVTFLQGEGSYTQAQWDVADWDNPSPCPLTIRLAGTALAPTDLESLGRLRRLGWNERVFENSDGQVTGTAMTSPGGVVECRYRVGRLTSVTVDAAKGDVEVGLGGRWVGLPNSAEEIATALGPALPKK